MTQRINLIDEQWVSSPALHLTRGHGALVVENSSAQAQTCTLRFPLRLDLGPNGGSWTVRFAGRTETGAGCGLVLGADGVQHYPMPLDSWNRFVGGPVVRVTLTLTVGAKSRVRLTDFWLEPSSEKADLFSEHLRPTPHLVVTPSYPSSNHLYLSGFVHSRVVAYRRRGLEPTVLCTLGEYKYQCVYEFDGVRVFRGPVSELLAMLNTHEFEKIGVHFFDEHYALAFDRATGNRDCELLLWCHGPETLFWDLPRVNGRYFERPREPSAETVQRYRVLEKTMASFERRRRVRWIFVSEWMRERSRALLGLAFERSEVIANTIDTVRFAPVEKSEADRRRVLMIRRYDDERKYGVDLAVQAILELSRRDGFDQLAFTIVGEGPMHDTLFAPLAKFRNVTYVRRFANHAEIAELHRRHGLALFPTRYDSQGVSACEAASSGLVVVSSASSGVSEFIDPSLGTLAPENTAAGLADAIHRYAFDAEAWKRASVAMRARVVERCAEEVTIGREVALFTAPRVERPKPRLDASPPALTVCVPVYNMEKLLERCLSTLLAGDDLEGLEVLVIDDGSKDRSLAVARRFEARFPGVVRVIAKENGGHGSVINRGLAEARGRYFRLVDSDDWVDEVAFSTFLRRIRTETVDVVLTDYAEDRAHLPHLQETETYANIVPDVEQPFDMLADPQFGFRSWGPVLASATFRLEPLRRAGMRVDEGIPYVDMEYSALSLTHLQTARYYPLSIYRYFLGRPDQTVERASFEKKHPFHEQVIFRIAEYLETTELSAARKAYLRARILGPMIDAHRRILGEWLDDAEKLQAFDERIRTFRELADIPLPPPPGAGAHPLRAHARALLFDSMKTLLPYRLVRQLEGQHMAPHVIARHALEYVAPTGAVLLFKKARANSDHWRDILKGDVGRAVDERKRQLLSLVSRLKSE